LTFFCATFAYAQEWIDPKSDMAKTAPEMEETDPMTGKKYTVTTAIFENKKTDALRANAKQSFDDGFARRV
jgi:hypothetical protein